MIDLICDKYERQGMQCVVVEDEVRCNHGVRNLTQMLCTRHYARWQRNGHTSLIPPELHKKAGNRAEKNRRVRTITERAGKIKANGGSLMCLCTHDFMEHRLDAECGRASCKCTEFDGANQNAFAEAFKVAQRLSFTKFLNRNAWCRRCCAYIEVGAWYEPMTPHRMRSHLRAHPPGPRFRRAG